MTFHPVLVSMKFGSSFAAGTFFLAHFRKLWGESVRSGAGQRVWPFGVYRDLSCFLIQHTHQDSGPLQVRNCQHHAANAFRCVRSSGSRLSFMLDCELEVPDRTQAAQAPGTGTGSCKLYKLTPAVWQLRRASIWMEDVGHSAADHLSRL